jgi:hypothetical protein
MPSRVRSKREQRDALTRQLRAEGQSWAQVAARIQVAERVSKRVAMRLARGWTQWEVARRWNERWPAEGGGGGITAQVISYWETWPHSGREPSVRTLWRLALIYDCGIADLIDAGNYASPGEASHGSDAGRVTAGAGSLVQSPADDAASQVPGAPHEITGTLADGSWATAPPGVPSDFAYRGRTEAGSGGSAAEREVVMAAHEGSEHAESAERRDIGDATLEQVRADVIRLSREYMTGEPFVLFGEMRRVRSRVHAALDRRLWPRDEADLFFLLGCLNSLMASAASALGYRQPAEELVRAGWAYASVIDHRPLMACLRLNLANIAHWSGRTRQCRDLAQDGLQYLSDGPNAAMLHLKYGRAAARLGDAAEARRAIAAASEAAGSEYRDDLVEIGGDFDLSRASQHYLAGSALIEIPGAEDSAAGELGHATDLYAAGPDPGETHGYTMEALARIELATARLRAGHLDGAVAAAEPVLALPSAKRITSMSQRLGRVRAELASPGYRGSAEASSLDERIEAFLSDTITGSFPTAS